MRCRLSLLPYSSLYEYSVNAWLKENWLKLVAIVMALGALASFPYVYYQLLNWVIAGAALLTAWQAHRQKNDWVAWLFAILAVIFNPIAPLYLGTGTWQILDVIAAVALALSFIVVRTPAARKSV